jgi:hypothetical protein
MFHVISWGTSLPENLTVAQLLKKFTVSYGTITPVLCSKGRVLSLSQGRGEAIPEPHFHIHGIENV